MHTRIQKWGNSLAIRIPRAIAAVLGLTADTPVELKLTNSRLEVTPLTVETPELERLLDEVTEQNIHGEYDTGAAMGREVW
jgi:antitoxin MazE